MNVLLINGSPHAKGSTYVALKEIQDVLQTEGIDSEIMHIGSGTVSGCVACRGCKETNRCVRADDVNIALDKLEQADGLVIGSPVYFASVNGSLLSFLDRMFYAGANEIFALKPCACVTVARRAGTTATLDILYKYPMIKQMPVVSSTYWPMIHGMNENEVTSDEEGMQVMRGLGHNMAWLLHSIEVGKKVGLERPQRELPRKITNFVR